MTTDKTLYYCDLCGCNVFRLTDSGLKHGLIQVKCDNCGARTMAYVKGDLSWIK